MIRDESGKIQGVRYEELAPMLLNEIQRQQQGIAVKVSTLQLRAKIHAPEKLVVEMQAGRRKPRLPCRRSSGEGMFDHR